MSTTVGTSGVTGVGVTGVGVTATGACILLGRSNLTGSFLLRTDSFVASEKPVDTKLIKPNPSIFPAPPPSYPATPRTFPSLSIDIFNVPLSPLGAVTFIFTELSSVTPRSLAKRWRSFSPNIFASPRPNLSGSAGRSNGSTESAHSVAAASVAERQSESIFSNAGLSCFSLASLICSSVAPRARCSSAY